MNDRNGLLSWSIPGGTLFATRIRISVFFPLLLIVLCYRLQSIQVGLAFGLILYVSTLMHEFGHVFGARATGGSGDEILMWPFGGLAFVQPANRLGSQLWTTAAGPLVNLMLCIATFWPTYHSGMFGEALNPLVFPRIDLSDGAFVTDLFVLAFIANWLSLLINLIPVYPLDGGQMLHAILADRMGRRGTEVYLNVGLVLAVIALFGGLMFDNTTVVFLSAVVLLLNLQESMQHKVADQYGDDSSFMGYDFSQGYTSLERDDDEEEQPAAKPERKGWLARWRERRREEREAREREQEEADAERLDALLEKVQEVGMDGLTAEERRFLERTSARMREKGKPE